MINASDLINLKNSEEKKITDLLTKLINSKISFIRIACHFDEVFKIKKYMAFLKKKKIKLIINIMQISEISGKSINYINLVAQMFGYFIKFVNVYCVELGH